MVVVAPPCFEIAPELVGKPPREILFLAPPAIARELIKQFLALCVLGRLRASLRLLLGDALHPLGLISRWRRRRRDHVGEHIENLRQGSDRAINEAAAAADALIGDAAHLAKDALIALHVALELAPVVPRRALGDPRFSRLGPPLQLGVDHLLLERRRGFAFDFQGGACLNYAWRRSRLGQASLNPVLKTPRADPEDIAAAGDGREVAFAETGKMLRPALLNAGRVGDDPGQLLILPQRLERLDVGRRRPCDRHAGFLERFCELLAVGRLLVKVVDRRLERRRRLRRFALRSALLAPFDSVGLAHRLFRVGDAEKFPAVDAGEALLDLLPMVAGRALIDTRDIAAPVNHGEAFRQGAVPPADRLGERRRPLRGLGLLPADMHQDQPPILDCLRKLFRRPGELPGEADFAGGLSERLDLRSRRLELGIRTTRRRPVFLHIPCPSGRLAGFPGAPDGLHVFRPVNARQLAAVEAGEPLAGLGQGHSGQLLVERVLAARGIDDNEAIAAIPVRQDEAPALKRRLERLAVVRLLQAVQNGCADVAHVRAKAAAFLDLVASGRARPVVRRTGLILVIEDDRELCELLEVVLKEDGHRTASAPDGPAALDLFAHGGFRPDLILVDYNLPNGMDGLVVAAKIRETLHRHIPVIVLTGDISTDTLRRIASEDCVQLNKPVKAVDVMQAIQRLLAISPTATHPPVARRSEVVRPVGMPVIFVVDDDSHVREGIRSLLEADGRTVEDFATCEEFLEAYHPGREGCLLVDAYLPGMNGHELLQLLHDRGYRLPAIMITGNSDVPMAVEAMKGGASDFIEKPVGRAELLASLERALEQSRDTAKLSAWRRDAFERVGKLTLRQRQVMEMVLAGHPSKNVAADLGISQRTVENHRASIMKRMGVKSLPALARLALAAASEEEDKTLVRT
jgi:FixJ family two-component response regulator